MRLVGTVGRFEVVNHLATQKATDISVLCSVLDVSRSGYYKWRTRREAAPTERETSDIEVAEKIKKVHKRSGGTYGVRRVHRQLRRDGMRANRKRVAPHVCSRADRPLWAASLLTYDNPRSHSESATGSCVPELQP